jgi:DNA-binding NarL/FixJ family response regulator
LSAPNPWGLTPREIEVCEAITDGYTQDKQIARWLGVGPRTVQEHIYKIFQKLGVSCRVKLALTYDRWARVKEAA